MKPEILHKEIVEFCKSHTDETIIKKYSKYFKEGYDAYGLAQEIYQSKVDELSSDKSITLDLLLETAPLLISSGKYEETSYAIGLVLKKKKDFNSETFDIIEKWFEFGINNWAHTDFLSGELLPYFILKNIVPLEKMSSWRFSAFKFQRRAVPVTMIKLLKTVGDFDNLFSFIEPLMTDKERVVHQGLGWFLREAWKKQPEKTEAFLYKWKDTSARLIFQYATEKMDKEQRLRFRKSK
jgi:3-methyladenine DNA glycosylase AlkD